MTHCVVVMEAKQGSWLRSSWQHTLSLPAPPAALGALARRNFRATVATLRQQLFAQAGYVAKSARKTTLKLATARQRRQWMLGL